VADFKLSDAKGKSHTLAELKGAKGTVIVFMSTVCPMVKAYNDRIIALATDFQAQGVNVIGINANFNETAEMMRAHGSEIHYNFTILKDKDNKIADALGAERTPETILLDANNRVIYRGRIDSAAAPERVEHSELRDAIGDLLAGRPVAKPETTAVGCSIKRPA
jgi:peroxiredoxin